MRDHPSMGDFPSLADELGLRSGGVRRAFAKKWILPGRGVPPFGGMPLVASTQAVRTIHGREMRAFVGIQGLLEESLLMRRCMGSGSSWRVRSRDGEDTRGTRHD